MPLKRRHKYVLAILLVYWPVLFVLTHIPIPPRAWSYNSNVETVHSTIELEFFDLENFENIKDFHQRIASFIIHEIKPNLNIELVRLPPIMLDWVSPDYITREELSLRGYDLPCYPLSKRIIITKIALEAPKVALKNCFFVYFLENLTL